MNGKPAVFTDGATDGSCILELLGNIDDYEVPRSFKLAFDLLISSENLTGATFFSLSLQRNGATSSVGGFGLNNGGMSADLLSHDTINPAVSERFYNAFATERVMEFLILFDAENDQLFLWIDSELIGSIALAPDDDRQGVRRVVIESIPAATCTFAIDNIRSIYKEQSVNCDEVWMNGQGMAADVNQDCYVDVRDLAVLASEWVNSKLE